MALGIASDEAVQDDKIGRAGAERRARRPGRVVRVGLRTRVRRVGVLPGLLMLVLRLPACCVQVFVCTCASCMPCVCSWREREEGDGICFCVDREGRGQLLLQVQTGARGWSMELNGLLFKAQ